MIFTLSHFKNINKMKKEGYAVPDLYQGGYSTFDAPANTLYNAGSLSLTTDARTANVIQEVSTKLSSGVKNIEIEGVSGEIFDSIPKQHLKEVNRISKLTGSKISIHAPVINVSGIDTRSGTYSEVERENAERRVAEALQRSHELDPEGNIPVNFHSAEGIPGSQMLPPSQREIVIEETMDGERKEYEKKHKIMLAVNQETGRIAPLKGEEKFYPGGKGGEIREEVYFPEKELEILNDTEWDNSISQLFFNKERADEILERNRPLIEQVMIGMKDKRYGAEDLPVALQQVHLKIKDASMYLDDLHKHANAIFSRAYKYGDEEQKAKLKEISKEYGKALNSSVEGKGEMKWINPFKKAQAMHALLLNLQEPKLNLAPKINVPLEEFTVKTTSKTFGNAAYDTYKKFKEKGEPTPLLNIENPPAGFALSTGEDIKRLVEASREQFVKRAIDGGMSENQAKQEAKKILGATLDLGHMNMLRKYGYSEEEIVKESEKMAPFVKHIHLSDNFGFDHTELPMGMGNVPTKEIMQKIESKLGKKKAQEMRKVIEAVGWWQHMKSSPLVPTLELAGSSVYRGGAPYWNQIPGFYQDYSGGFGQMLPQINYETFGAGFSQLPSDLGGQRPGSQGGRMSGRPME